MKALVQFIKPCRVSGALPNGTALMGFCRAPLTVATYMVEGSGSRDYPNAKAGRSVILKFFSN